MFRPRCMWHAPAGNLEACRYHTSIFSLRISLCYIAHAQIHHARLELLQARNPRQPCSSPFYQQRIQLDSWRISQAPASSSCRRETRGSRAPCLLLACGRCALDTNSHTIQRRFSDFRTSRPGPPANPCSETRNKYANPGPLALPPPSHYWRG
jgi:hypothetical protein